MKKIYSSFFTAIFIVAALSSTPGFAQNMGFEAPAATPPTGWVPVTLVWSHNTDATYVRTGGNSMQVTDPATSGSTIGSTNGFVNVTSTGNYLITIAWGKSNTASNAAFNLGYRLASTNTLNPSSTATPPVSNHLNNTTWTRVVSASLNTVALGTYGPALRAFRVANTAGTTLYMDDFMIYQSASNVPDLSDPDPVTGATISSNSISWANGLDNGSPASGISGVVILRADGAALSPPSLNDQAMYATTTGTAGTGSFSDGVNTWTVVANIDGNSTTNFVDGSFTGGPYTYVIYMRDMAYNYSTGVPVSVATACTEPPTPGTAIASPTVICPGSPVNLGISGASAGTGQTYQWKSAATINGSYTNIGGLQTNPALVVNPNSTTFYRVEMICSGGTPVLSAPVEVTVRTGFSGTYTINSNVVTGGTNYQTFSAAIADMTLCGITGAVVFNVDPSSGPYTEQVTIPVINGASSINTVTINGNGRTLQFTSTTSARHILKLDGADYVTIDNLNIVAQATDFGWGIHLMNSANNNTIRNCGIDLMAVTSTTASASGGIIASNSATSATTAGSNASHLKIQNCTIRGGYHGIILHGLATGLNAVSNIISHNLIRDCQGNGIEITHHDSALVEHNDISRPSKTTMFSTAAGIEVGTGSRNVRVDANIIHDTHTSVTLQTGTAYGIFFSTADAPVGSENYVTNNLIYNFNSLTGIQYGLYNSGSDGVYYYHNTVVLDNQSSTAGNTYAFYQTTLATNIIFKNNILYVTRGGTGLKNCIRFNTTTSEIISNNNVLYINSGSGTVGVGFYSTNHVTLADWKTANNNAYDQQSVDHDPLFVNPGGQDFKPTNAAIDNIGANVGVPLDILGNSRFLATPDPGAYEFNSGVDVVAPTITYPALPSTAATSNRTLTATIVDFKGIQIGANGPRLYYKKSTSAVYVFTSYITKTGDDFSFLLDHAALGGVSSGDVIQYYVAAQDSSGNGSTGPSGGGGVNPPGTTPPGSPNSYTIIPTLAGTYQVGTGQTYEKLTNLANAINNNTLLIGGHVIFELTSAYDGTTGETFPINFNEFPTNNPTWTVTIRPASGVTNRITSGDPGSGVTLAAINFNGGDRYIFDGRPGGTGTTNEWTIRNTRSVATIGSVIRFVDDATNNTLRNLNIESQATSTTTGVVFLNTSTGALGNSFNSFLSNNIRGSGGIQMSNGIYSSGTAAALNSNITVSDNHIYDFANNGINVTATGNGANWSITGNHIYNTTSSAVAQSGILIASATTTNTTITGNFIGGSAPNATGTWLNTGSVAVGLITITNGIVVISNNTLANVSGNNVGTGARTRGINFTGSLGNSLIEGNTIHDLTSMGAVVNYTGGNQAVAGIHYFPTGFQSLTVNKNTIYNLSIENPAALATSSIAAGIMLTNMGGVCSNNTIYNIRNKSTGTTPGQPPIAAGIYARFLTGTVVNNMIALGEGEGNNIQYSGILVAGGAIDNSSDINFYFNSVLISGTASGDISSYAFLRGDGTATSTLQTVEVKNNILANQRTGGGSKNYAIGNQGLQASTYWSSNYNDLYSADPSSIGLWNTSGYDFTGWKTTSNSDSNSVNINPVFVTSTNLHLDPASNAILANKGVPINGIPIDFDGDPRSTAAPDLGADEFGPPPCTLTTWTGASSSAWENPGNWSCGIPTQFMDVVIPDGSNVVVNSVARVRSLTLAPTASIMVSTGANLMIYH